MTTMKTNLNFGTGYDFVRERPQLEALIAKELNISSEHVKLTNGANGALEHLLSMLKIRAGSSDATALIDVPNYFDTLKFLEAKGYTTHTVDRGQNYTFPKEAMLQAIEDRHPYLIVLTTPNNPTGIPINDEDIIEVMVRAKKYGSIVLIDKSCLNTESEISTSDILHNFPDNKVVVVQSYSKSHGLAGQRLGYFATNDLELARYFADNNDDGRVSERALGALRHALDHPDVVEDHKAQLRQSHAKLQACGAQYPQFQYSSTTSNFALIKLADKTASALQEEFDFPTVTKERFGYDAPGWYRINVSDPALVQEFIAAYEKLQ